MKIVVAKDGNTVIYFLNDQDEAVITEAGLVGAVRALDVLPDTHAVIEGVSAPSFAMVGGALAYFNGQYAIVDQARYEAGQQEIDARTREDLRARWKAQRQALVDSIVVVTTTGKSFDGDERSQERMTRAIVALQAAGQEDFGPWVLADNSVANVTLSELIEALRLAGSEQAAIWTQQVA